MVYEFTRRGREQGTGNREQGRRNQGIGRFVQNSNRSPIYIDSTSAKKYGHDLAELQGQAMERLRLIYPAVDMQLPASRTMGTVLDQNHPARRYAKSGLWSEIQAQQAAQRAKEIYLEIIPQLILDGKIKI